MGFSHIVTEREWAEVMDDIKDLLQETYQISACEASTVVRSSRERADSLVEDYMPLIKRMEEIQARLRDQLDSHLQLAVDREQELSNKMRNDAAVWLTFECIRRFCKKIPY